MEMADNEKETNSSSWIPRQSDFTFRKRIRKLKVIHAPSKKRNRPPRAPLSETDSVISSVSMRSNSSMFNPLNFNPQKKQSCAVCEEAVKDPVLLPCGHWSCKQCSHSFWDECGDSDPCKKCGERSEREKRDQDLQSVLLEKTIKRVEMETEKLQAEKETFQAEKEKFQAEKETFELEKRKLALEIQLLEQKGKYTNYDLCL